MWKSFIARSRVSWNSKLMKKKITQVSSIEIFELFCILNSIRERISNKWLKRSWSFFGRKDKEMLKFCHCSIFSVLMAIYEINRMHLGIFQMLSREKKEPDENTGINDRKKRETVDNKNKHTLTTHHPSFYWLYWQTCVHMCIHKLNIQRNDGKYVSCEMRKFASLRIPK